jgi:hypothetical protein
MEAQDSNKAEYECTMPFVNQQPDFAFGFECGMLYGKLEHGEDIVNDLHNTENAAQIEAMLKRFGYVYTITSLDCGWILINAAQLKGTFN